MELVVGDCWLDFGFFVDNLWSELPWVRKYDQCECFDVLVKLDDEFLDIYNEAIESLEKIL